VIVDNYVYSFSFHLDNGIPIVPFFGESDDQELLKLTRYIEAIHCKEDLREPNKEAFQLTRILGSQLNDFVKFYYDFGDNQEKEEEESEEEEEEEEEEESEQGEVT